MLTTFGVRWVTALPHGTSYRALQRRHMSAHLDGRLRRPALAPPHSAPPLVPIPTPAHDRPSQQAALGLPLAGAPAPRACILPPSHARTGHDAAPAHCSNTLLHTLCSERSAQAAVTSMPPRTNAARCLSAHAIPHTPEDVRSDAAVLHLRNELLDELVDELVDELLDELDGHLHLLQVHLVQAVEGVEEESRGG